MLEVSGLGRVVRRVMEALGLCAYQSAYEVQRLLTEPQRCEKASANNVVDRDPTDLRQDLVLR